MTSPPPRSSPAAVALLLAGCLMAWTPAAAQASGLVDSMLGGGRPPGAPYVAPGRLFRVTMPAEWKVAANAGKNDTVEFTTERPRQGSGVWRIHRRTVPAGARAKQLMLHALEQRQAHLPHLRRVEQSERMVGGLRAAVFTGEFWWQGNAQYPRVIQEIFVVLGTDAFELHLEAFPPLFEATVDEREAILGSFVPRPTDEGQAAPSDEEDDGIQFDKLPF